MITVRQLGAFIIILIIIIGSVNITINQHLCNGEIESTALFVDAQPCEHAFENDALPPCHKKANKKKCCSTNQITIQKVDWFKFIDVDKKIVDDELLVIAETPLELFKSDFLIEKEDFSFKDPPTSYLLKEDIYIWNESYLI